MFENPNKLGPIGRGWVEEKRNSDGIRYVARWSSYIPDSSSPEGRKKVNNGYFELGPKVKFGDEEALKSLAKAKEKWAKICDAVMGRTREIHPVLLGDKPLSEFWPIYAAYRATRQYKESSVQAFNYYGAKILAQFRETPLAGMNYADVQNWLNSLAQAGKSKTVVEHCLIYVRGMLKYAHRKGCIREDFTEELALPPDVRSVKRSYLPDQKFKELLKHLPTRRDRIIAKILYLCCLRRRECFALLRRDYANGCLSIERQLVERANPGKGATLLNGTYVKSPKTKASKSRVGVPPDLRAELDKWIEFSELSPDSWLFCSRRNTPVNSKNWLDRVLKPAGTAIGIPDLTYHTFRRGYATVQHVGGQADTSIQGQMRHSSPNTTRTVYMQVMPEVHTASVEALEKRIKAGSKRRVPPAFPPGGILGGTGTKKAGLRPSKALQR